jgi:hypothetical protein
VRDAGTPESRLADRQIAVRLSLLTFFVYAWFYAGAGWNQNSQFDLTRAIVERTTFAIDSYQGNTGDISRHDDHVYSNKSPGLSVVAAVPYAVLYAIERHYGVDVNDAMVLGFNCYLCTVVTVGLFGAWIPALIYLAARRRGASPPWSVAVALTMALATQLLPYGTLFMLHVPSAALMLYARAGRRDAAAGFCAGAATVMNYLCAPAIIASVFLRGRRGGPVFAIAALPPLLFLAIYQHLCFGSLSTISIAKEDPRFLTHGAALGVFGKPSMEALYGITFSPYRGLFYFAPVLLMAIIGLVASLTQPGRLGEVAAIVFVSAVFFAFNVSFNGWEGGFGIGARYLVPIIPLLGILINGLRGWTRLIFAPLAVLSLLINFAATAVDPQPSGTIPRPLTQYILPLLVNGHFSPSVPITPPWSAATFTGHTSVNRMAHDEAIVFSRHAPGSAVSEWSSFNLGEAFFGPGDARSLAPIAMVVVFAAAVIFAKARAISRG